MTVKKLSVPANIMDVCTRIKNNLPGNSYFIIDNGMIVYPDVLIRYNNQFITDEDINIHGFPSSWIDERQEVELIDESIIAKWSKYIENIIRNRNSVLINDTVLLTLSPSGNIIRVSNTETSACSNSVLVSIKRDYGNHMQRLPVAKLVPNISEIVDVTYRYVKYDYNWDTGISGAGSIQLMGLSTINYDGQPGYTLVQSRYQLNTTKVNLSSYTIIEFDEIKDYV